MMLSSKGILRKHFSNQISTIFNLFQLPTGLPFSFVHLSWTSDLIMVMHCKCMLRELHLLCSITQHFSFCFLDMSLDMSFASLLCSNWPLFSHSQDRLFISLPGCSAPSISASSSCFAGNADTMPAHLLLLHPSLCNVIRHPYSKVDSWKNCPAWCQNLISQKGFEKKIATPHFWRYQKLS